jgi:hypothetical protein
MQYHGWQVYHCLKLYKIIHIKQFVFLLAVNARLWQFKGGGGGEWMWQFKQCQINGIVYHSQSYQRLSNCKESITRFGFKSIIVWAVL